MWPTIPKGGGIIVDKSIQDSEYEIGDIVVFKAKDGPAGFERQTFTKRIVARGGDTVQMRSGRLVVNGIALQRDAIRPLPAVDSFGRTVNVPCYIETNGSAKYKICEINGDNGFYDRTEKYTVPKDNYFLMGDNRDNSDDSRDQQIGYISASDLVGKVIFPN